MRNIEVYLCSKNVNFTPSDTNRPLFHDKWNNNNNTKPTFKNTYFSHPSVVNNFMELNTLTATINVAMEDIPNKPTEEVYKSKNYMLITIDNFDRYYFITSARVRNNKTITYTLKLDTITTYLDRLTGGGEAKIERIHRDGGMVDDEGEKSPNFNDDSLLGTEEKDMSVSKIVQSYKPVNVLSQNNPSEHKRTGGPVMLANSKEHMIGTVYATKLDLTTDSVSGVNMLLFSPYDNFKTKIPVGKNVSLYRGATLRDFYTMGFASYINLLYASPLPFINPDTIKEIPQVRLHTDLLTYFIEDNSGSAVSDHLSIPKPEVISFAGQVKDEGANTASYTEYQGDYNLREIIENDFDNFKEGKSFSNQFYEFSFRSVKGDKYVIPTRITGYSSQTLKLYPYLSNAGVGLNGVIHISPFSHLIYKHLKTANSVNDRTFNMEFNDPMPSPTSAGLDFVKTSGAQYKAGIANNKRNTIASAGSSIFSGIFSGIAGAGVSAATGNPLGLIGGAAAMAKSSSDAFTRAIEGVSQDKMFQAQKTDLLKQGTSMNLDNYALVKDIQVGDTISDFGDSKLALVLERGVDQTMEAVDNYFVKYGYTDGTIRSISSYSDLNTRKRFTYVESPIISEAFVKDIPQEAVQDINDTFRLGVRLGVDGENIGNYSDANREFLWKN